MKNKTKSTFSRFKQSFYVAEFPNITVLFIITSKINKSGNRLDVLSFQKTTFSVSSHSALIALQASVNSDAFRLYNPARLYTIVIKICFNTHLKYIN